MCKMIYVIYIIDKFMKLGISVYQGHPYHLVSPSPWPLTTSLSLLILTTSGVLSMHNFLNSSIMVFIGLFLVNYSFIL